MNPRTRWVLFFALVACQSSAPYAMQAAAVNTAAALSVSAVERSKGGCYAQCTLGSTCNPNTGLCESARCAGGCRGQEVCAETEGIWHCVQGPAILGVEKSIQPPLPGVDAKIGISPETGRAPPSGDPSERGK